MEIRRPAWVSQSRAAGKGRWDALSQPEKVASIQPREVTPTWPGGVAPVQPRWQLRAVSSQRPQRLEGVVQTVQGSWRGTKIIHYKTEPGKCECSFDGGYCYYFKLSSQFQPEPVSRPVAKTVTHLRHLFLAPRPEAVKPRSAVIT